MENFNFDDVDKTDMIGRYRKWRSFIEARGVRYEQCKTSTFICESEKQIEAVKKLDGYIANVADNVRSGNGVIVFGSRGTGKDHLAVSVCREAIRAGFEVAWVNGMSFFGSVRDSMGTKATEESLVQSLLSPDLLYVSDPLPPTGSLTEFQQSILFRVLDGRYSALKPCIVTVNVSSGKELDERLGASNADRLRDGATAIFCDWPSYRKVKA